MKRIILIRHARTAWNTTDDQSPRFRGTIDLPLTSGGQAQAATTSRRLAALPLTAIYSSPLQRAVCTAQAIAEPHDLEVQAMPDLGSIDYGDWAGQPYSVVANRWPDLFQQWRRDPYSVRIPGGESLTCLRDRVLGASHEIMAHHKDGDTVVIVSHQIVTKTLVCGLMGLPGSAYWLFRQGMCNLTRFDYDPSTASVSLASLNDTCHLDAALPWAGTRYTCGTRIVLVRHGQTAWNVGAGEERFRGRTDLPLDDTGRAQALAVADRLQGEQIEAIYTSSLLRTRQTAQPLAQRLHLEEGSVRCHDGLLDINYGHFQGLTHSEAAADYPELYALWHTAPGQVQFPEGEALLALQERVARLLTELIERHPGQTVALFGHQIVNKVIACTLLGLGLDQIWRVRQDTAGLNLYHQVGTEWHTLCLNDTCHL